MFTSFAQNYEDVRLWRVFKDVAQGRYIDVGAQEPTLDSVSRAFYDRGWRGINVEPNPLYADLLRKNRINEEVIEAAVSSRSGTIQFHASVDNGLSTGREDIAAGHMKAGYQLQKLDVETVTLDSVFDRLDGPCHWLKIDVEGMEKEAIDSWNNQRHRPIVVIVEATAPNSQVQTYEDWEPSVLEKGYKFVTFDGLNRWYLRHDSLKFAENLAMPINIFDDFQVTPFHCTVADAFVEEAKRVTILDDAARSSAEYAMSLRAALDEIEKQFSAKSADLDSMRAQFGSVYSELEAARARVAEHDSSFEQNAADLKDRWADKLRLSLARAAAAKADAHASRREAGLLQAEVARLSDVEKQAAIASAGHLAELHEARTALQQLENERETARARITDLTAKLEISEAATKALDRQVSDLAARADKTAARAEEASHRLATATADLTIAKAREDDLESQLAASLQQIEKAAGEERRLQAEAAQLGVKLAAVEAESKAKLDQARDASIQAERVHRQAIDRAKSEVVGLQREIDATRANLTSANQERTDEARRADRAEAELKAALQAASALEREKVSLAKDLTKQAGLFERSEKRIDTLVAQAAELRRENRDKSGKLMAGEKRLLAASDEQARLKTDIDRLERRMFQLRAESADAMKSLVEAQARIDVLLQDHSALQAIRNSQDRHISQLTSEVASLRSDISIGDAEVARLDNLLDRVSDDLRRAQSLRRVDYDPGRTDKDAANHHSHWLIPNFWRAKSE